MVFLFDFSDKIIVSIYSQGSEMKYNLKKMAGYYKPYMGTFYLDIFFAFLASLISLVIPLVVRYITTDVVKMDMETAVRRIVIVCIILAVLVLIQFGANYFITNIGHVMGAKMEYDMRAEIFAHYQKLSFSFFDDQKVGRDANYIMGFT